MKSFLRSRTVQIGFAAFAALNLAHAGVIAQGAYRAYYANDPLGRNLVTVMSRAPLETILTQTGLVEADVRVNPANVLDNPRAKFVIDVKNFDTGIAVRNDHMLSADWVDAAKYPTATFTLTRALPSRGTKKIALTPNTTRKMPVEGVLEFRGVKRTVRADVECTVIPATEATSARLAGDLIHIKANFPLKMSDYNLNIPAPAQLKVANVQDVNVDVFVSTGSKAPAWSN